MLAGNNVGRRFWVLRGGACLAGAGCRVVRVRQAWGSQAGKGAENRGRQQGRQGRQWQRDEGSAADGEGSKDGLERVFRSEIGYLGESVDVR